MKILFINAYPMDRAYDLWKEGTYPAHHLWGTADLKKYNIDVDILPHEVYKFLNKTRFGRKYGNFDQQVRVLLRWPKYDLVYSACQINTHFLSILRSKGIFNKPILTIMHRSLIKNDSNESFLNGHDRLLCLSKEVKKQLSEEFPHHANKIFYLPWAVDMSFYSNLKLNKNNSDGYIFSAGKTGRDYDTLIQAFHNNSHPLFISCDDKNISAIKNLSPNIKIRSKFNVDNKQLLDDYNSAFAVAIPLIIKKNARQSPIGITSLLEAMAMGKAVIMTRYKLIDIDIEKEGIGIWVEPNDVAGWKQAVEYLYSHPDEAVEMGKRGRSLCENKYNMDLFTSALASHMKELV